MAESRPGVSLIATRDLRYGTRRLTADDGFVAGKRDARLLVAIGKARYATEVATPAQQADIQKHADGAAMADLRLRYVKATGKRAFNGWDAETLRQKIAAATK